MSKKDTIYALSSAYGKAGVSVFRISGPSAFEIVEKLTNGKKIIPNKMFYSGFYNCNLEKRNLYCYSDS